MVTMENQCTEEQKEKWMEKVRNFEIIGTYAQTELGHGMYIIMCFSVGTPMSFIFLFDLLTIFIFTFWEMSFVFL